MADNDQPQAALTIWNDPKKLEEIKGLVAQNLTNTEFQLLVNIGKATDLNPFLRDIYAVKYGNAPASIFIGKNGYIKIANSHPAYDGHETEYIRDAKGAVIGCKATVYHKQRAHPVSIEVFLEEYGTANNPLWKSKKLTMIRKVALVQALRESFPETYQGTYDESEEWQKEPAIEVKPTRSPSSPARGATIPTEPTVDQVREVEDLMRQLDIPQEAQQQTRKMLKTAGDSAMILGHLHKKLDEKLTEMKEKEVFEGKAEASKLMEEVKALLVPSIDKTPLVQLEEAFAQYCGSDIKPETATVKHWKLVKKMLEAKRKEQEKEVAEVK